MNPTVSRRGLLLAAPALLVAPVALARDGTFEGPPAPESEIPAWIPSTDPAVARTVVGLAHSSLRDLRRFVEARPTLALATTDWGFGDFETAIGAASHTGQRDIVQFLMEHGARPDIFTYAMLGDTAAVRAMVGATPGVQRIRGPHGITLLAHARAGGDASRETVSYLESLGDADRRYTDEPLTESEKTALLQSFVFGKSAADSWFIGEGMGGLTIKRGPSGTPRRLFHQGHYRFHPAGAPGVRIEFNMVDGGVAGLTVADAEFTIHAMPGC